MKVFIGADPGGPRLGWIFPFSKALINYLGRNGVETTLDPGERVDIAVCIAFHPIFEQAKRLADNGACIVHRLDGRCRSVVKCYEMDEVVRRVNAIADWTVFQSEFVERHTSQPVKTLFGEEAPLCSVSERSSLIYNGVDTTIFSQDGPRKKLKGRINILHVAISAGDRKKASYVVKMAEHLKNNPDIHFYTLGNQHKDLRCGHIIKDNLLPNLTHLGPILDQEEIASYMRSSTVLLFPSVNDYCPNTVLEAMSCGLPIWYDDSGGTPELVRDGKLVAGAPLCAENPVWPLDSLINNHASFQEDAMRIVQNRFTLEAMGERYLSLFNQLLEERGQKKDTPA